MDLSFPYFDENTVFQFPSTAQASEEGIVAMGGNLSPGMLLSAYRQSMFPWYSEGEPILWWSPDPRLVLFPEKLHISHSMIRLFKQNHFSYTVDQEFEQVMRLCGAVVRKGQDATWITENMIEGYTTLYGLGFAHSVEVWLDGGLAGGLYGLSLGSVFFGESMFSKVSNASKAGYILFVKALTRLAFGLIDCQVYTPHLVSLGAEEISRQNYISLLDKGLEFPAQRGNWSNLMDLARERNILIT